MRRLHAAGLAIMIATGPTAVIAVARAASPPPKLRVSPAAGHRRTVFTVHFTAPAKSGRAGVRSIAYRATVTGPAGATGCVASMTMQPVATSAGQSVAVGFNPRRRGGRWCAGAYTGQVTEIVMPSCGPPIVGAQMIVCPAVVAGQIPLGTFSFRVHR
jgi:hypothetical protein